MQPLTSAQRKELRGLAHHLQPIVLIGKEGVSDTVVRSVDVNLTAHELVKIRFNDHKKEKKELSAELTERTNSELAGIIGHVAILYRQHKDPEKRKIKLKS